MYLIGTTVERVVRIELTSLAWKAKVITTIRYSLNLFSCCLIDQKGVSYRSGITDIPSG